MNGQCAIEEATFRNAKQLVTFSISK